jgi:hypothetical protein
VGDRNRVLAAWSYGDGDRRRFGRSEYQLSALCEAGIAYHNHHPTEEEEDHLERPDHSTYSNFSHPSLAPDLNLVEEIPYLFPPDASEDPFLDRIPDRTPLEEAVGNDAFQVH